MFGFFEKKKEKEKQLDLAFDKVAREIRSIDNWDDPKKLEHYILDSCEQIIGTTKEIEAEKAEYRKVTAYLADMKTISDLPVDKKTNLMETAKQIEALDRSRTNYQNRDPRISEEMFLQIEENEDDLPQTIRRMMDNEKYQRNIQGSMHYLEGEKSRLEVEREDTSRNRKMDESVFHSPIDGSSIFSCTDFFGGFVYRYGHLLVYVIVDCLSGWICNFDFCFDQS